MIGIRTIVFGMLGAIALHERAPAQDPETLVVTASRVPVRLERAGSSVTVVTREQIRRRQAVFVADLLRSVPGVSVSRSGPLGAQTQLRVRGAEANHALVFIDGVEANDPAVGDEYQFEHMLTADVERIEIVRGPQSALWGSDALGGVINIVTRDAGSGRRVFVETGSFDTTHAGTRLAFSGDGYGVDLGAAYVDSEGSNIARLGDEDDGYESANFNISADLRPADTLGLELAARYVESTTEFDAVDAAVSGLPADADALTDSTKGYLSAKASLASSGAFDHELELTYLDTLNESYSGGARAGSTAAEKAGLYYEGHLVLADSGHGLTFALDREVERFVQRANATPFGDPNQRQRLTTTGYVIEYRGALGPRLDVSVAGRYDTSSDFESVATYRLAASYELGGTGRIRASYGTGQKSPTFVERYGYYADVFIGNRELEPEKSEGWELGYRRELLDGRISFDAVYFNEALEDEINGFFFDPAASGFTAVNEPGRSERRGVELEVLASIGASLDVAATYTYLDASEPRDTGAGRLTELRRPRHTGSLNIAYALSPRASIDLDVAYTGERYDTFFPPGQPSQRHELGSYRLVTLAGRFDVSDRLELFGRIENLLDEDYEDLIGFATPGRGAYLGVRADLGSRNP